MPKSSAKWTRRAAARPDEILDAALDVFIEAGFDAARMDDIAARARRVIRLRDGRVESVVDRAAVRS